jgi:hypothetical protein
MSRDFISAGERRTDDVSSSSSSSSDDDDDDDDAGVTMRCDLLPISMRWRTIGDDDLPIGGGANASTARGDGALLPMMLVDDDSRASVKVAR